MEKVFYYALTILGKDRVGIIKEISGFLASRRINIDDSSMTRLRNEFAMILLLASRQPLGKDFLKKIKSLPHADKLEFHLKSVSRDEIGVSSSENKYERRIFSIKVYGADRTGIVSRISSILAAHKINIIDMRTKHIGDPAEIFNNKLLKRGIYILIIESEPTEENIKFSSIKKSLLKAARSIGCHLSIDEYHPAEL